MTQLTTNAEESTRLAHEFGRLSAIKAKNEELVDLEILRSFGQHHGIEISVDLREADEEDRSELTQIIRLWLERLFRSLPRDSSKLKSVHISVDKCDSSEET